MGRHYSIDSKKISKKKKIIKCPYCKSPGLVLYFKTGIIIKQLVFPCETKA